MFQKIIKNYIGKNIVYKKRKVIFKLDLYLLKKIDNKNNNLIIKERNISIINKNE